jgi:hypothetical protein
VSSMRGLDPAFKPFVDALLSFAPQGAYITSGRRSGEVQQALYIDFITGKSKFPAARPGGSLHERGLAVDIGGLSPSQLKQLGELWESWGGRWGGRFRKSDPIHFDAGLGAGAKRSPKLTSKRSGARQSKPRRKRRH